MAREPTPLQRELRQRRPFPSLGAEAVVGMFRTADLVKRRFTALLEPHGITPQQYNVLRILRGAGRRGLPTLAIAERMVEQTPGITRLLDRLEAKGWVRRERCAEDRRQVLCHITPAGLRLLGRLDEPVAALEEDAVAGLDRSDRRRFIAILDAMRARAG